MTVLIIQKLCVVCHQYQHLTKLEIGESAQVYAAFLVYLDLTEGECPKIESCINNQT